MNQKIIWPLLGLFLIAMGVACGPAETETAVSDTTTQEAAHDEEGETLTLPAVTAVELGGEKLRVVATTSIIGDVVAQVAGDAIDLTVLMEDGQDPHSYEPNAGELTAAAGAHVIFVNGWNLEEGLANDLDTISEETPIVPVSAGVEPLTGEAHAHNEDGHDDEAHEDEHKDEHEEGHDEEGHQDKAGHDEEHEEEHEDEHKDEHGHDHGFVDPHVWFDVANVQQWASNVAQVLGTLDPANADAYAANAEAYRAELDSLAADIRTQMATIPAENRLLITNHDSLDYFAAAYGLEVVGTVIPAASTLAEPSASDLVDLVTTMSDAGICTLFTETTANDQLAQAAAAELDGCEAVQVLPLYTGAVGPAGSGADSYIGMMRANLEAIVAGLGQ